MTILKKINWTYFVFISVLAFFIYSGIRFYKRSISPNVISLDTTATTVKFSKTFFDVGFQKLNVPVKVGFVIYNTGANNLFIENVLPDCHCTAADYSVKPIQPNDSSIIILKYDASNPGPFQSSAVVTTNSLNSPTLLIFRGNVEH